MAIDIGDAVLSVIVDQSQANAQLAQFGAGVTTQMAPATTAVKGTSTAVGEMSERMAVGAMGARELGEVMELSGEKGRFSMYEARGEAGLLGEMFGIHLPRHVRSFIAEIPGVGAALSGAFAATAILFIIEALAKGIEKIIEFAEHSKKVGEAWDEVDKAQRKVFSGLEDGLLKAELRTAELTGNHLEALRLKLQLIDNSTLGKLDAEFEKLAKEAEKAFKETDKYRSWFTGLFGFEGAKGAEDKFGEIHKKVDEALSSRTPEAFAEAMKAVDAEVGNTEKKFKDLAEQQKAFGETPGKLRLGGIAGGVTPAPVDPATIEGWKQLSKLLQDYKKDIQEAQKADEEEKKESTLRDRLKEIEQQKTAAKTLLDTRLDGIQQVEAAEKVAFAEGRSSADQWAHAQIKAADDSASAHIKYKQQLASIAQQELDAARAVDVNASSTKAKTAAQEASNEKVVQQNKLLNSASDALIKANTETSKLRAEMEKLAFPAEKAHEQAQAFKELEAAEKKLAEAEQALELADPTRKFEKQREAIRSIAAIGVLSKEQEAVKIKEIDEQEAQSATVSLKEQQAAIQSLARFHILSKQQESALLARADDAEKQRQLKVLEDTLAQEKRALDAAQAKFKTASASPIGISDAELAQLKTKLDEAQIAWDKTQTKIVQLKASDNSKLLSLDKSYYGQALALLVAFGNKELATKLAANHAALLEHQNQLKELKSRKDITQAVKDQIAALEKLITAEKKEEKELEHTAKQGLSAWKQFSQGFRSEAQQNEKTMEQMSQEMRQDLQQFAADLGQEFAAMIQGQESFGQAMAHATEKLIGSMAQQWGEFFAAKAIADIFFNPALGAAEFAAAVALFTLGSLMGSLSSSGGSKSASTSAPSGTPAPAANSPAVTAGSAPAQTVNVPHLSSGGLVMQETLAVVHGGEAVVPLSNHEAMRTISTALAGIMSHSPQHSIEILIRHEADIPGLARVLNHNVKTGRVRLVASDSIRHTKRS